MLNHVNSITNITYKNDPSIMAFELVNEPRCSGTGAYPARNSFVPATLTGWFDEVSTYFKEIDTNHLLAIGDEGYFNHPNGPAYIDAYSNLWDGTSGNAFDTNIRLPNVDFGKFLYNIQVANYWLNTCLSVQFYRERWYRSTILLRGLANMQKQRDVLGNPLFLENSE